MVERSNNDFIRDLGRIVRNKEKNKGNGSGKLDYQKQLSQLLENQEPEDQASFPEVIEPEKNQDLSNRLSGSVSIVELLEEKFIQDQVRMKDRKLGQKRNRHKHGKNGRRGRLRNKFS